jgi:hypothetical protein
VWCPNNCLCFPQKSQLPCTNIVISRKSHMIVWADCNVPILFFSLWVTHSGGSVLSIAYWSHILHLSYTPPEVPFLYWAGKCLWILTPFIPYTHNTWTTALHSLLVQADTSNYVHMSQKLIAVVDLKCWINFLPHIPLLQSSQMLLCPNMSFENLLWAREILK